MEEDAGDRDVHRRLGVWNSHFVFISVRRILISQNKHSLRLLKSQRSRIATRPADLFAVYDGSKMAAPIHKQQTTVIIIDFDVMS